MRQQKRCENRKINEVRRPLVVLSKMCCVVLLLAACGESTGVVTVRPTFTPTVTPTPTMTPTPTVTPIPPTYLHVESTPSGATVRIGLHIVNGIVDPTTGRVVGLTPLTVQIYASDVDILPSNGEGSLTTLLTLSGYFDHYAVIGLGPGGPLDPGRTYTVTAQLNPIT